MITGAGGNDSLYTCNRGRRTPACYLGVYFLNVLCMYFSYTHSCFILRLPPCRFQIPSPCFRRIPLFLPIFFAFGRQTLFVHRRRSPYRDGKRAVKQKYTTLQGRGIWIYWAACYLLVLEGMDWMLMSKGRGFSCIV